MIATYPPWVATADSRCMFGRRRLKLEGPVSVMTIGALEVRMRRGMRLHITSSLRARREIYAELESAITVSVYQAPQRRFAVNGNVLDGRREKMKCIGC